MGRDLRLAIRSLRRGPAVGAAVIATFALALSAVGVTWGVFDAVVLRAVPGPRPDRVAVLAFTSPLSPTFRSRLSLADAAALKSRTHTLEHVAAYAPTGTSTVSGRRSVQAARVSASSGFFEAFGVSPLRGRWFSASDAGDRTVVISDDIWARAFDREPAVIGHTIDVDGQACLLVGVAPAGFNVPDVDGQIWLYRALPDDGSLPSGRDQSVVGRPRPGITFEQVATELNDFLQTGDTFPVADGVVFSVTALRDQIVGSAARSIAILGGAVSLLLLIACVNVASLLLARQAVRHREAAIRRALGATRLDFFREAAIQVVTLAAVGAAIGFGLAVWETRVLRALGPRSIPGIQHAHVDLPAVAIVAVTALIAALAVALLPATGAWTASDSVALREGGLVTLGARSPLRGRRGQSGLVAMQIALVVSLATGAGLLTRSLVSLLAIDVGFNPRGITAYVFSRAGSPEQEAIVLPQLLAEVRALPGVTAAALSTLPPFLGLTIGTNFDVETRAGWEPATRVPVQNVTSNYFSLMGIPIVEGRVLSDTARWRVDPCEVMVNQSLARSIWPRESPLRHRIDLASRAGAPLPPMGNLHPDARTTILPWTDASRFCTVVGVVQDVREKTLTEPPQPRVYFSPSQFMSGNLTLLVRTASGSPDIADAIRSAIQRLIPAQRNPITPHLIEDEMRRSVAQPEFYAWLFGMLAGLALALAVVGVFGVTWHAITQRTHEIGIRLAIGAEPGQVVRLMVRDGAWPIGLGTALGVATAAGATRYLVSLLHEVTPLDPLTFAAAPAAVALVAILAVAAPALRARRIDPKELLRAE